MEGREHVERKGGAHSTAAGLNQIVIHSPGLPPVSAATQRMPVSDVALAGLGERHQQEVFGVTGSSVTMVAQSRQIIVVVSILAALIVPNIIGRPDEARQIAARQDIASLMQALKLYRLDNQRYPTTEQGLQALVTKPATGPIPPNWKVGGYVERLPKDPWGHPYQYLNPGVQGEIDVFSYGADGAPGGEGIDADIGSWNL